MGYTICLNVGKELKVEQEGKWIVNLWRVGEREENMTQIRCMEFSENGKELHRLTENWRDNSVSLLVLDNAARN